MPAVLTMAIPHDGTIPQNSEGTVILTASITLKIASNGVRVRFAGPVGAKPKED